MQIPTGLPDKIHTLMEQLKSSSDPICHDAFDVIASMASNVKTEKLVVSLHTNRASRGGRGVTLSPKKARILNVLNQAYPCVVSVREIEQALEQRDRSINVIRVQLCEIRRAIAVLGVNVVNIHGRGYQLEIQPPARSM